MIGKLFGGRYEIIELIGYGGMALVYKAKDLLLNRLVAIKVLKNEFNDNEQFIKKFKRESQSAASLSHNNIVNVFDVGIEGNNHYIVMEYVNGKTLKAYIKSKEKLPWKESVFIAKQIAFALDHAHRNNIIHRDIKPHNILLNEEMIPKVTDFGIARAITSSTITLVEETMGSVHYISPEQARGGFVDEKSDLYSLGVILYEMLTGKVPFDSDNSISIAIKHIQDEIIFPKDIEDIPLGLVDIINKLVKKNPIERYHSARELIKDLILIQNNPSVRLCKDNDCDQSPTKKTPIIDDDKLKENNKKIKNKKIKKTTLITIIILSVLFGILIFVVNSFLAVKDIEVPNVEGLTLDAAAQLIEESNLKYQISSRENSGEVEEDHVISQSPVSSSTIKEGQTIKLIISNGPKKIELPDVTGKYEVEGTQDLENMGFSVKEITREFKDEYEKGIIYDQNPLPGTELAENSEVKLYVSKGKDMIIVPDIVGEDIEDAKQILLKKGFIVGTIKEVISEKYEKDIVISQDPDANNEIAKDSVINITVSKGLIKTKSITINLNEYLKFEQPKEVSVKVILFNQESESTIAYENKHLSNETINVVLKGVGVQNYQIQIDEVKYDPVIINF
ncbi:MAG: Stk1 family PASTA domain-containing Ser/Thr kinase [Eubacteriaceae bacterium]